MPCIEARATTSSSRLAVLAGVLAALLAGCHSSPDRLPSDAGTGAARPTTVPATASTATVTAPDGAKANPLPLPEPRTMSSWVDVRRQAAERLVAANPAVTYTGKVPDQLLAIPVLEIELNGDGSIRRIEILREPRQAKETMKIAIDAIRRAAPYGNVSKLPRPWKFVETFLFDEARRFKPRTLDA